MLTTRATFKGFSVRLLWKLAPKFDLDLRQSGTVDLEPWQQEIRDYVSTARKPTIFAQRNLVEWAKRRGLVKMATTRIGRRRSADLRD